ncbi:MAG TPA: 1-deoxy-D-xylulose-5-phosphate reductoisomerase [Spirochaetota bacterium]|nr:1-deoxy-D-xylulose-5-phosphate reductoisomerase [Spirochaetota bacterium]HPI90353.1 1-deoxy-D-xylulose-5-phosphate reductoisomerase [Spirochaetota bacterium]HPR48479.1 1-deoxy-D-xylulose-5-phosphate reductoisomerase [Spirochaetota bacterium]
MKDIAILGSTGSIGVQALEVIRARRDDFRARALTCNENIDVLERQVREHDIPVVAVVDEKKALELQKRMPRLTVLRGMEGVDEISRSAGFDMVLNALVGSSGILPTLSALKAGTDVALANKETLVAAGDLVMKTAEEKGAKIFPVDSEHSAIFQCLNGEKPKHARRLILTCSGGPFRNRDRAGLRSVSPAEALKHPRWNMGKKISIDSATLMNKGLEVIEARMLFGIDYDRIEVVIHPQSIIHSLVEFVDGSVMAQLGPPDMKLPIQYALTFPERAGGQLDPLDLTAIGPLQFDRPDTGTFTCLKLAYEEGKAGGSMPCLMNAANEVCVSAFLAGKIGFMDIPDIIKKKMDEHTPVFTGGIEPIIEIDASIKRDLSRELELG